MPRRQGGVEKACGGVRIVGHGAGHVQGARHQLVQKRDALRERRADRVFAVRVQAVEETRLER